MSSPYINTKLCTSIMLHPSHMNNNLYNNLKKKLVESLEKRCFGDYGYIIKIFKLESYEDGIIEAENTTASALYNVTFTCRLCKPLKGIRMICEVERINKVLVRLKNGPIFIAVTGDRVNTNVFFKDNYRNLRYKVDNKSYTLKQGDFVKVNIVQTTFYNGDTNMFALGFLEGMATDNEIEEYYMDEFGNQTDKFVDYETYITEKKREIAEVEAEKQLEGLDNENDNEVNKEKTKMHQARLTVKE